MKKKVLFLVTILTIVLMNSCKDNGTGPTQKPFKNPREMTWTADTLKMPDYAIQLLPRDLLVVSPDNIWLTAWVGHGQIYHYNGKTWEMVKEIGGGINCLVQGNTPNSIWAGGYIGRDVNGQFTQNAYLGYYNGTSWQDNEFQLKSELLDISKDTGGNIWTCGRNGLVMKYENNKWIADTFNVGYNKQYPDAQYLLKSIEHFNDRAYMLGSVFDFNRKTEIYYFFSGNIHNWELKDSMVIDSPNSIIKWGYYSLSLGNDNELYSFGLSGIWKYTNTQWKSIFQLDYQIFGMHTVNSKYIYAMGPFNHAFFHDGISWDNLSEMLGIKDPQFVFANVWTNGYETIITGYGIVDNKQRTIIWHGK